MSLLPLLLLDTQAGEALGSHTLNPHGYLAPRWAPAFPVLHSFKELASQSLNRGTTIPREEKRQGLEIMGLVLCNGAQTHPWVGWSWGYRE